MSFWNEMVKFFGGDVDEKEKVVDTAPYKEKENELVAKLEAQDNEFRNSQAGNKADLNKIIPKDPDYKFLEYQGDSEKDIEDKVADMWGKENMLEKEEKILEFEEKKNQNINKKLELDNFSKKQLFALNEKYKAKKEQNKENLLAKGLARSSILEQSEKSIDEVKSEKDRQLENKLEIEVEAIDKKLKNLEVEQNQAVSKLDLHYATKIEDKIATLKKDREKAIDYIEKYNNNVVEKISNYKKNRENAIQDYNHKQIVSDAQREKNEMIDGYSGDKKVNFDNRLNMAIDFYKSVPKEAAGQMIKENNYLKTYLGNNFGKLTSFFATVK